MQRRDFLKILVAGAAVIADEAVSETTRRALPMAKFRALYLKRGGDSLLLDVGTARDYAAACYLLRDTLANMSAKVHPWLLHTASLLQTVAAKSGKHEPLIITSGFRTLHTNTLAGGAKKSYHMANPRGFFHAMDVHMQHTSIDVLAKYALAIGQGGVGEYDKKGFVHIDVGPPRTWGDI